MAYTVSLPNGQTVEVPDDVSPDQAYAQIQQYWEEMNRPPAEGGFVPAVKSGYSELKSGIAALLGKTGAIDEKTALDYMAEQEKYQQQTFKPTAEGWTEAPWQNIKELAGQSLPWMAAPVAAAGTALALPAATAGTAVLGGATTLGTAVATGAALIAGTTQYAGSNLKRQMDEGASMQEANLAPAVAAAVPQAVLDRISFGLIPGVGRIFGAGGKKITEETAAQFAKQGLAKAASDYTASTGKAMTAEGLTEAAQQFLERMQAGLELDSPEAREEYWQSLVGGAVLGGAIAPAGRFLERGGEQAQARQLLEDKQRREDEAAALEQATKAAESAAEKESPEYAKRVSDEYLGLEDQIKQLRGQLIKEDAESPTATADKLHNEGVNKQIDALKPKLQELASEFNRVKNIAQTAQAAPAAAAPPEFIPEDVAATLQNPLGSFKQAEVGPDIWKAVNRYRKDQGKPLLKEYSIEDIRGSMPGVNPKAEQGMIDSLIAARTGYQGDIRYTPEMLLQAAKTAGVDTTTKGFKDFLNRSTGTSELGEMSQPQMHVAFTALTQLEPSETSKVLPEGTNATHFSEKQYQNFLNVFRLENPMKPLDEGMMLGAVKEATGLTSDADAKLFLDEAVKRGDIDQQKRPVFRVVDPATNKLFTTTSNEARAQEIAAKRNYEVRTEDVNDYVLGKAPVQREGFGIEEAYSKTGEAPSGFDISDNKQVLHTAKTEAEAKARAAQIGKKREGMAKAIGEAIRKIEASVQNAEGKLVNMEAQGQAGTPQYQAAKVQVDAFKRKAKAQINDLIEDAKGHLQPLSIKPAKSKPTGKPVYRVTEKGLEGEFATQKEAEEHILANASNERIAELAQKGHPLISKRAQSELRRRSEVANKEVAEQTKAAEQQKAQDAADDAQIKELEKQLKPLLTKFGMGDVALNISKALRGGGVEAEYVNKVITLAIDVANPVRTMRHESLHALHDLGFFTEGQWKMLNNMADKVWIDKYLKQRAPDGTPLQPGQVSRFELYQQRYGADNIELLREEAIADAFGDFDANGAPKGVFATLLQKMRDFFESLKNVFTGAGYGTAEGVFRKVEAGELKATTEGGGTPKQAKPSVANAFKATKAEEEQADKYEAANGILPYTSAGYVDVPVKYSIKGFNPKKDYGTHPLTGQPLNKDGTMTVYYHTTKAKALEIGNKKLIPAEGRKRIYLTNESSGAEVLRNKGNFDHELDGSAVLINIDPDMLQIDMQYDNGRMDFFVPTAQGDAFFKKMQMQSIQKSRQEAITDEFSYADHEKRISSAVKAFKALTGKERAAALKKARNVLKQQHNVTSLMTENGKLEKTRTGEYKSGLTVESNIASMGLGLASAQKITDKANTCPRSAICEGLCLGETSGGNFMFGGAASEDVGDISKSSFRAAARMMQYLKTEALIMHPEEFATVLQAEIDAHNKWCAQETQIQKNPQTGKREKVAKEEYAPAFRLNVTSDFKPEMFRGIIEANPQAMFYDYTKLGSEPIAKNHHLTYSSTGFGQIVDGEKVFFKTKAGQYDHNWATMRKRLDNGQNVAMAFSSKSAMPNWLVDEETGVKYAVLNGDDYDARFLDDKTKLKKQQKGRGVIVGLKNKAGNLSEKNSTKKTGGFFVNYDPKVDGDTVVVPDQAQFKQKTIPIAKASLRSAPDTPEFKRWFGDSKVVDAEGKPLVVYHGTREGEDFNVFDVLRGEPGSHFGTPDQAGSFTRAQNKGRTYEVYLAIKNPLRLKDTGSFDASSIAAQLVDARIISGKQADFYFNAMYNDEVSLEEVNKRIIKDIQKAGYDGIVYLNRREGVQTFEGDEDFEVEATDAEFKEKYPDAEDSWVALSPTQIKSAIGNNGQFDATNPDIRASLREAPKFYEDIPNDNWLKSKVDYAKSAPRSQYGVPRMTSVTGSFSKPVMLPVDMVKTVPGQNGEQSNVRKDDLEAIRKIMAETGKLPLTERGEEYAPFITIGYDGKPWVSEGNHRIMAAAAEGWKTIPVEVRYFDGGQREAGAWAPDKLLEKDQAAIPKASLRSAPDWVDQKIWDLHLKAREADALAENPGSLKVAGTDRTPTSGELKRRQTMTFRRLNNAMKDAGLNDQDSLNLMVRMNEESGRREAAADGIDVPEGVNADDWARHLENMDELEKSKKYSLTTKRDLEAEVKSMPNGNAIWSNMQNKTYARVEKGFVERLLSSLAGDTFSKLRAQAIHRYNRLGEYERRLAAQNGGIERLADQNAESAALMSDLAASVTTASFGFGRNKGGVPVYKDGYTTVDNSKKGLLEVLRPLAAMGNPDAYRLFQNYMAIRRGSRYDSNGVLTQFKQSDMAEADALEQKFPEFKQVRDDWIEYNNGIVDYMVATGVLSRDKADMFKQHADYIPFYRQIDDEAVGPQIFTSLSGLKKIQKLKGGDQMLGDFLETVIRNSQSAIQMGMKNVAAQRAVKLAEQLGEARVLPAGTATTSSKHIVTVMENGEKVLYESTDPLFLDAVKSLNMAELPFLNILSAPANLLRSMVTKDPGFILANMLRDSVDAYIRTGTKMTPVIDTLGNFSKNVFSTSPELAKLYNAGILGGYEASGAIQQTAAGAAKELRKRTGTRTAGERAAAPFTGLWQQLENLTEASDAATRIAVYKDTLRRTGNEAEALFQSLELMNFHRKGSSPVMRIATAAIPFLNARLQGLDALFRTGIRPLYDKNATTRQKQLQKTMLIRGLTILGLSTMYAMAVTGDPEYEKQEDETRDNNWIIPIGNTHIKIPIPFEIGTLFKTVPERAYRYALGVDTSSDTWDSANRAIRSTFAFNPMPQAFNPLYEVQTNYSQYTRRPIISQGMENIESKYQYDASTPTMFKVIGEATGLSPKKMEHLWQGYTGTMGTYAVQLMDSAFDGMGMPAQASKRFEQMPVIKRFVADPEARGQVTAFYDLKNRVDEVVRTVNLLQKEGSPELAGYMTENATLYAARGIVSSMNQQMMNLNGYAKQVRSSDMKPDEKRDLILQITKAQNDLTNNIRMVRKVILDKD